MVDMSVCQENPFYFLRRKREGVPVFQPIGFKPLKKAAINEYIFTPYIQKKPRAGYCAGGTKERDF
jgi:hypothetical protein